MRKSIIALLAIAAAAAVACQPKEEGGKDASLVREVPITFTAELPGTRTFIEAAEGGWQPYWQNGDEITVTHSGDFASQKGFVNSAEDGLTGTFSGTLELEDGTHTIYAYYPAAMKDGRAESTFKFILPEEQSIPSLTTFDPAADLLVSDGTEITVTDGALSDAATLHFNRIFAVAKIVIADGTTGSKLAGKAIKSVTFKTSSGTLTGRASVDITTAELTAWEGKSSYNYVTASYEGSDWTADGQNGAFVVINPTTLASGSTVSAEVVTDDDSIVIERTVTLSNDVVFQTGKINTITFSIKDDDIEEDTGIEPTTWDFSEAAWQEAFALRGEAGADITGWNFTLNNLKLYSNKKSKYGSTYFQWGGAGNTEDRYLKFTATSTGKLTVWASNTGSSEDLNRMVAVLAGDYSESIAAGTPSNAAPTECVFKNVPAGEVLVYPTGNGLRFYKLTFTGEVQEEDETPEPGPDEGGEQECTNPPATGTVDPTAMYGFAEAAGVTGGDNASSANILHFNDGKALQTWLLARTKTEKAGDHSPVTIWLSGTFGPDDGRDFSDAHPWFDVKDVSNLSFYGTDDFVMDRIGIFCVRANNIIIRNINFRQPKANNGADAVSMQECDGVWVDHCTFTSLNQTKDYEDGSTDVTHGSKNVTVSWCHYIKTQKTALVGHSNSQTSDTQITATFHHNWFDQSSSRHPRVRFGWAHAYNNLYDGCTTYGAGSAYGAKVLVEYNYFDAVQLPTDICTYPAKENGESNLQGSVAGYLYPTENIYVNRPEKAKDPYPLCNVKYTVYGGTIGVPFTYEDFQPSYDYIVTPAADVPSVVKANAGYGKLGWTSAPVEVNNGGVGDDYNGSEEPDTPTPDDSQPHTYTLSVNDSKAVVQTVDGVAGASYFDSSTSTADFSSDYNGPTITVNNTAYKYGLKFDSKGYVNFTTSSTFNTTVQFWFIRRKNGDETAKIQLIPEGGTATVLATPYDAPGNSGVIELQKGTSYTIKQSAKEQALIYVIITETE